MIDRTGEQLGKYRLMRVLGQSQLTTVYLAQHIHLHTQVALKVPHSHLTGQEVERFLSEAQTIARLLHPHIVRIFDFDVLGGTPFLVMEYAPSGTLRQRHPPGQPVALPQVLAYLKPVAQALQFAHDHQVIHCDVKPENLLVGPHDTLWLSDFGIATLAHHTITQDIQPIVGTIAYMAPEQLQGKPRPASDQYALGVVVYEWLTGRRPFEGMFVEVASQHVLAPVPSLREQVPALPAEVEQVVLTALAKDPHQRFASVRAFAAVLEQASFLPPFFYISSPTQPGSPTPFPPPPELATADQPTEIRLRSPAATPPADSIHQSIDAGRGISPPQQRGNKVRRNLLLITLIIFIIPTAYTAYSFFSPLKKSLPPNNGIGVTHKSDGVDIGISDGSFAFDTFRPDGALKYQAAEKLKVGDPQGAMLLWQKAIKQEPNDAEALIYLEDQRVLASGRPYITLVVGTLLTRDFVKVVGHSYLQGAYLAQKEFNDHLKLPGGVQVRLLIANSGDEEVYVTTVAKQIVQAVQVDKTIVGVMGWPFSGASRDAISVLSAARIPMISPTASTDFLTGISPYFFRIVAPDKRQTFIAAQYIKQQLHAKRAALFVDPDEAYSTDVAEGFRQEFLGGGNTIVATENYSTGKPEMLPGLLQDALNHNPDLIYFANYAYDATKLLADLPTSGPFAHLQMMGPDALYDSYPTSVYIGLNRIHFTAFACPDEWDVLAPSVQRPVFFTEYSQAFDLNKQPSADLRGCSTFNDYIMLSYDAVLALLTGSKLALTGGKTNFSPSDLQRALTEITGSQAIQGVTGKISFGPDGNPINKVVILMKVDSNGDAKVESMQGSFLVSS